jgi:hypothetical protein
MDVASFQAKLESERLDIGVKTLYSCISPGPNAGPYSDEHSSS